LSGWLVVVDRMADLPGALDGIDSVTTRDYLAGHRRKGRAATKLLNLSRDVSYQSRGYYCSLLAEARGQKVVPSVTTLLELRRRSGYAYALPELEEILNRLIRRLAEPPEASFRLRLYLGTPDDPRFQRLATAAFDWFRAPVLDIAVQYGDWWRIRRIRLVGVHELGEAQRQHLAHAIDRYARRRWRRPRTRSQPRFTLAVLHDGKEPLPPSELSSLRHFARIAEPLDLGVEIISKKDQARLPEYDALWIRETTNIDHHTYRFALRAEQESMPVIDDPGSIMRCTNKVYLAELLHHQKIGTPRTFFIGGLRDLERIERALGYPIVLKVPDGSFSRGVRKAETRRELESVAAAMLEESDLILAQEFMYTTFDWRVGVLDGSPLFVTQYRMAKKHWQIVRHTADGRTTEGGFRTVPIAETPAAILETALRATRPIGNGLYGVDLKANDRGVFVIEVNDNPNLNHGVEDLAEKDEPWRRLAEWFLIRLDRRRRGLSPGRALQEGAG